jgi:beta-glucanase (GH16 family)
VTFTGLRCSLCGLGLALVVTVVNACGGATVSDPVASSTPSPRAAPSAPSTPSTPDPTATPGALGAWRLVWADEFDGPAGTPPDPERWGYALGDGSGAGIPGWGNQELETYTDDAANAATDGESNLVISALEADGSLECWYGSCRYTSARLLTADRFAFAFGRVEARLQVAPGEGLWSAFWMLGTNIDDVGWPASGEIDIMENVGRDPAKLFGTLHGPGYSGDDGYGATIDLPAPLADDFHVYAIEWRPGHIVWTVDGDKYHEATPDGVAPDPWVYDHEFYVLVNLAVGGGLGGPVRADTAFPARYLIDYIRVYQAD